MAKDKAILSLAIIFFSFAIIFWLSTAWQPLIDQHEFRQTQTALTALYLNPTIQGLLNYETPVLGSPWSLPFEFPFYQFLVYWIARLFWLPLDSAGRLLSVLFGTLCVVPVWGLMRQFCINKAGIYCFIALYFG